ncbi:MAG: hypothetical protein K1X90_12775 [Candidatus Kapabacteria bacterium]|nr:hypothetical protein [Candidatus Kapabacteria bacterium]
MAATSRRGPWSFGERERAGEAEAITVAEGTGRTKISRRYSFPLLATAETLPQWQDNKQKGWQNLATPFNRCVCDSFYPIIGIVAVGCSSVLFHTLVLLPAFFLLD